MIPLLWPLAALVAGIVASPLLDPFYVWLCLPLGVLLAFVRRWGLLLNFFLLGAGLRSREAIVPPDPGELPVRLIGRLTKAPEWRGLGVYLDVELQSVDTRPYGGRARLTEFLDDPEIRALFESLDLGSGDRLEILVKLHRPVVYRNPGVFDFRRHLERQQIYWTGNIRNPRLITIIERGWHGPDRIKNWISRRLETQFAGDRDAQGLVMGMVLGRKYGISAATERLYQAGGIYHLVVISGFQLAVVAWLAFGIVRRVPCKRPIRLTFVLLAVGAYTALVDGQAPVSRAALMVGFIIAGKLLDRGHAAGNSIAGTALVILLADPGSLEDSSFQMTFAAVIAVVGFGMPAVKWAFGTLADALTRFDDVERDGRLSPDVADWRVARRLWCELHRLPTWIVTLPWRVVLVLGEVTIVSLCVETVFVFFMVESFHRMSPASPLINVPAGLISTAVTPLGLATFLLPAFAARMTAYACIQLLHLLSWIVNVILKIPGASLRVPSIPGWIWIGYFAAVATCAIAVRKRRPVVLAGGILAVLASHGVFALASFPEAAPKETTLTFIDVGQGDSILVETPDGKKLLIDGGGVAAGRFLGLREESTFSIGENVVSPFLWSKGIRRLDAIAVTHAHHDHIDGLLNVIDNFQVGEVWLGRNPMTGEYRELLRRAMAKQIPLRWLTAPDALDFGTTAVSVLHPPANWKPRNNDQNNDSLVLLLDSGNATALLTGDVERSIDAPDRVDVYKIPHHGSRGVKLRVQANVRVVSVGANNPFGHPHPSVLPALRTDQLGAITVTLSSPPVVGSALTKSSPRYKLATILKGH